MNDWQNISLSDVGTDFQYFAWGLAALLFFAVIRHSK
jgi:hypothetical protein